MSKICVCTNQCDLANSTSKYTFCVDHKILNISSGSSGDICITMMITMTNKTNKKISNISLTELSLLGFLNFALIEIKALGDNNITTIDKQTVLDDFYCTGELLIPEESCLNPCESVVIIYKMCYIGTNSNLVDQNSTVTLSSGPNSITSILSFTNTNNNCGACNKCNTSGCQQKCYNSCNTSYDYINKCLGKNLNECCTFGPDSVDVFGNDEFCKELENEGGFLKFTNWVLKEGESDVYVEFDYLVEGDYEIVYAYAILGDGTKLCLLDLVLDTPDPTISGTVCTPIGRPIDLRDLPINQIKHVIRYLTFCLRFTDPDAESIFTCEI